MSGALRASLGLLGILLFGGDLLIAVTDDAVLAVDVLVTQQNTQLEEFSINGRPVGERKQAAGRMEPECVVLQTARRGDYMESGYERNARGWLFTASDPRKSTNGPDRPADRGKLLDPAAVSVALLWATIIVEATWPLLFRVQTRLWNTRWLAVAVMIPASMLSLIVPLTLAVVMIVGHSREITDGAKSRVAVATALPRWSSASPCSNSADDGLGTPQPAEVASPDRSTTTWTITDVSCPRRHRCEFVSAVTDSGWSTRQY